MGHFARHLRRCYNFWMHPSLRELNHRPWPLPRGPWRWRQSWNDLLFVHYPVPAALLRGLVPSELKIQEFGGTSYVGIVPFRMQGVMSRGLPDLPGFSHFLELNLRLYVEHEGKSGVWFLSLDATNPFVVWAGRAFFSLPYHNAKIALRGEGKHRHFHCRRQRSEEAFEVEYEIGTEPARLAQPGTLEHFLTERYCFFTKTRRGVERADVHHLPWPLQKATGDVKANTLLNKYNLPLEGEPLLHYSPGVSVVNWNPVVV